MKPLKKVPLQPQYHLSDKITVSHQAMWKRATEVAIAHGRSASNVAQTDWDEAKKEMLATSGLLNGLSYPAQHSLNDPGKDD